MAIYYYDAACLNAEAPLWTAWSYWKFTPTIPDFCPPKAEPALHAEAFRLLPNYAIATGDLYSSYSIQRGGIYPSLPVASSIDVNLNIEWTASCGEAINCN